MASGSVDGVPWVRSFNTWALSVPMRKRGGGGPHSGIERKRTGLNLITLATHHAIGGPGSGMDGTRRDTPSGNLHQLGYPGLKPGHLECPLHVLSRRRGWVGPFGGW